MKTTKRRWVGLLTGSTLLLALAGCGGFSSGSGYDGTYLSYPDGTRNVVVIDGETFTIYRFDSGDEVDLSDFCSRRESFITASSEGSLELESYEDIVEVSRAGRMDDEFTTVLYDDGRTTELEVDQPLDGFITLDDLTIMAPVDSDDGQEALSASTEACLTD